MILLLLWFLSFGLFIYEITTDNFIVNFQATSVKRGELTNKMLNEQYNESQEADFYRRYDNIHESRTIYSMKVEKEVFLKNFILQKVIQKNF